MKNEFRQLLQNSSHIVGFTGAGVSTESGISDYRSKGGIWQKFQPVYLQEFVEDAEKRKLYWQRKLEMWESLKNAAPGVAHRFFSSLHEQGKLLGLITQNIDGLHEKSGLPAEKIINLHGTSLEIICLSCSETQPAEPIMSALSPENMSPTCEKCGGLLKPNTISFGQNLRSDDLSAAEELAKDCDLLIAAGSTLLVQPAATYPLIAKNNGAKLVILTLSDTPLDKYADLVIHLPMSLFLTTFTNEC